MGRTPNASLAKALGVQLTGAGPAHGLVVGPVLLAIRVLALECTACVASGRRILAAAN